MLLKNGVNNMRCIGHVKKGFLNIGRWIYIVIALAVIVGLIPTLNNSWATAVSNSTGASATLYGLGPLLVAAGIIMGVITYIKLR
jgi:hypothetical protein